MNNTLKIIITTSLVLLLIITVVLYLLIKETKSLKRKQLIRKMTLMSILAAFSVVLYFIRFPLPIFVSFLEINFSNVPILLASFLFGPIEGIIVSLIRTIIKVPFSSTLCVGELQDFIISIAISCISGLYYKKNKTKKGALIALLLSSITWVIIGVLSNAFVSIPIYIEFMFNGDDTVLINMIGALLPNVTKENYLIKYLLLSCLPFNILLSALVSIVTFLIYKKSSYLFKSYINKEE